MGLLSDADYDAAMLAVAGGDTVTLGGFTVPCALSADDLPELEYQSTRGRWGTPVAVLADSLSVTVRTGALVGLATGSTVTVRGAGYTVDRVLRLRNDAFTAFRAFAVPLT